jgi:hypothetical protein
MKKHIIITCCIFAVAGLFSTIAFIQSKPERFPVLSEKDVSLIETFIHEMNLLYNIVLTSSNDFTDDYIKFKTSYDDLNNLKGDSVPMFYMSVQAMNIKFDFSSVNHSTRNSLKDYEQALKQLSNDRNVFLKMYQLYKNGVSITESNKFLTDNGLTESNTSYSSK